MILSAIYSNNTHTTINATDNEGRVWAIPSIDSDVGMWSDYINNGGTVAPYPLPTLEELKSDKLADLANKRWQMSSGGIVINSMPISTDDQTIAKLTAAYVQAKNDSTFTVNWKVSSGVFVELNATTIIAVGDAVTAHVQACFNNEMSLTASITSATTEDELNAVDINFGWPSNN